MVIGTHLVLVSGGLNIFAQHHGGAKGYRLKLCRRSKIWYANSWGRVRDIWSMFNVYCACLINLHHSIDGNFSSHVLRPAIV